MVLQTLFKEILSCRRSGIVFPSAQMEESTQFLVLPYAWTLFLKASTQSLTLGISLNNKDYEKLFLL